MTALEIYNNNKDKFEALIVAFQIENDKINLSSFNDHENILQKHILDSLKIFEMHSFSENVIAKKTIADIGTGGGFPGLALAVAAPEIDFVLLDSVRKKTEAVQSIIEKLQLTNVTIINDRAENITQEFDASVSRAVASFEQIMTWSKHITKKNGDIFLYKSTKEEISGFIDKLDYKMGNDKRTIYHFSA